MHSSQDRVQVRCSTETLQQYISERWDICWFILYTLEAEFDEAEKA